MNNFDSQPPIGAPEHETHGDLVFDLRQASIAELIAQLTTDTLKAHNWQFKIIIPKVTTTQTIDKTKDNIDTSNVESPSSDQIALNALGNVTASKDTERDYEILIIKPLLTDYDVKAGNAQASDLDRELSKLKEHYANLSPNSTQTRFNSPHIDASSVAKKLGSLTIQGKSPAIGAYNCKGDIIGGSRHFELPNNLLPIILRDKISDRIVIHEEAYSLRDSYQGKGLGPILAHVLRLYAQDNNHEFDGLYYAIKKGNIQAIKIAQQAGYTFVGVYYDGEYIDYLYLKPDAVNKNQSKLNKQYYSSDLDSQPFLRSGDEVIVKNDLPEQDAKADLKYKLNVTNATINLLLQQLGYQTNETEPFNIENLIGNSYKKIQSIQINELITKTTKIISKNEKNKEVINEDVGTLGYNITINYLNRDNVSTSTNLWVGVTDKHPKTPIVGFIIEDAIQTYPTKKRRKK